MRKRELEAAAAVVGVAAAGAVAAYAGWKLLKQAGRTGKLAKGFEWGCTRVDQRIGWSGLRLPGALVTLIGVRNTLRAKNLFDTGVPEVSAEKPLPVHENV